MSHITTVLITAHSEENEYGKHPVLSVLNDWLQEEYPSSKPQFEGSPDGGFYTTDINMCDVDGLVERFRELEFHFPKDAMISFSSELRGAWQHFPYIDPGVRVEALEKALKISTDSLKEIKTIYKSVASSMAHDALIEMELALKPLKEPQ